MKYADDVLIVLGCVLILAATAQISVLVAMFVAGGMLILAGIVLGVAERTGK